MGKRQRLIKNVKVKVIDTKNPYIRSPRTIEIETEKGKITAPTRAATGYEYRQKAKLPAESTIDNAFTLNTLVLNSRDFEKFMGDNKYFEGVLKKVKTYTKIERYSTFLFEFYLTSTGNSESLSYVSNPEIRKGFLNRVLDIHQYCSITDFVVPYLGIPYSEYVNELKNLKQASDKLKLTIIPEIDLEYKDFGKLLNYCINELGLNVIFLINREYHKTAQSHRAVWDYNDKDVAFFISHTPRSLKEMQDLSGIHYMPFMVGDVFGVKEYSRFVPPKPSKLPEMKTDLDKLKFFYRKDCDLKSVKTLLPVWSDFKVDIKKEFNLDDSLDSIIDNIHEAENDTEKYNVVKALTRVHELKASTSELSVFRSFIQSQDTVDYVKSKPKIKPLTKENELLNYDLSMYL